MELKVDRLDVEMADISGSRFEKLKRKNYILTMFV